MPRVKQRRVTADPARVLAFTIVRSVFGDGAYPNVELSQALRSSELSTRDASFVTELVNGTCRFYGTYDRILRQASGRPQSSLQPAVVDLLRLGCHQILSLRVPDHAGVAATVDVARARIGERVTGLVNAVLRKVAAHDLDTWLAMLSREESGAQRLGTLTHHPTWIVDAYSDVLPAAEVEPALRANNEPASATLVCRPGLTSQADLVEAGAQPCVYSPFGARWSGAPGNLSLVRSARAGVQDEGSQLVAWAFSKAAPTDGPWLDLCAGPGGKSALLHGIGEATNTELVSVESVENRARLVASGLAAYPGAAPVICADGTRPPFAPGTFAGVLADVPCTGLGSLRRRPESRWKREPSAVPELVDLQKRLLTSAITLTRPGGVVAYVTCSPHADETVGVVEAVTRELSHAEVMDAPSFLPEVEGQTGPFIQLWTHRHGTDAMFMALLMIG